MASLVQGAWQPHTATINWCETDYEHAALVAELWNTASAFPMVLLGALCIRDARRAAGTAMHAALASMLVLIGIGTAAFHATLKYPMQMLDEVSMLLTVMLALVCALEARARSSSITLRASAAIYGIGFSALHFSNGFTVVFQIHVALMIGAYSACIAYTAFAAQAEHGRRIQAAFASYLGSLCLAALLWAIDENSCATLQALSIGNPQLHAWWHVLVSIAFYKGVMLCIAVHHLPPNTCTHALGERRTQMSPEDQAFLAAQGSNDRAMQEVKTCDAERFSDLLGLQSLQQVRRRKGSQSSDASSYTRASNGSDLSDDTESSGSRAE